MKKQSFYPLYYKGMPIYPRDDIPSGEVWFVNDDNMIIKKYPFGYKLNWLERWQLVILTELSNWKGKFIKNKKKKYVDWFELSKDFKNIAGLSRTTYAKKGKKASGGTLNLKTMQRLYRKSVNL